MIVICAFVSFTFVIDDVPDCVYVAPTGEMDFTLIVNAVPVYTGVIFDNRSVYVAPPLFVYSHSTDVIGIEETLF